MLATTVSSTNQKSPEDARHDVGIKSIGEHLLKGWVLLNDTCANTGCNLPLMAENRDISTPHICVLCDDPVAPYLPVNSNVVTKINTSSETHEFVGAFPTDEMNTDFFPAIETPYSFRRESSTRSLSELGTFSSPSMASSPSSSPSIDKFTKIIGEKLLAGWTLLGDENPHNNPICKKTPLMKDPQGNKYCVGCSQFLDAIPPVAKTNTSVVVKKEEHVDDHIDVSNASTENKKVNMTTTTTKTLRTVRKKDRYGNYHVYHEEIPGESRSVLSEVTEVTDTKKEKVVEKPKETVNSSTTTVTTTELNDVANTIVRPPTPLKPKTQTRSLTEYVKEVDTKNSVVQRPSKKKNVSTQIQPEYLEYKKEMIKSEKEHKESEIKQQAVNNHYYYYGTPNYMPANYVSASNYDMWYKFQQFQNSQQFTPVSYSQIPPPPPPSAVPIPSFKQTEITSVTSTLKSKMNDTLSYLEHHLESLNRKLIELAPIPGELISKDALNETEKVYDSILKCVEAIKACKSINN